MQALKKITLKELRDSRQQLLGIAKNDLSYSSIVDWWYPNWVNTFDKARGLCGVSISENIIIQVRGYKGISEFEVLNELRLQIVVLLDSAIKTVDNKETVTSVLEELILKIEDIKLSTLLKEFNDSKDRSPNISSIGFRTILSLIIKERAKKVKPTSSLATKDDLALDPDIAMAIKERIFDEAENRFLLRFKDGTYKVLFDNVAHKPNKESMVDKDELSNAVSLLNKLLPHIVN